MGRNYFFYPTRKYKPSEGDFPRLELHTEIHENTNAVYTQQVVSSNLSYATSRHIRITFTASNEFFFFKPTSNNEEVVFTRELWTFHTCSRQQEILTCKTCTGRWAAAESVWEEPAIMSVFELYQCCLHSDEPAL